MKGEILKILRETDGYVSGQDLCDRLEVSRTAVWKVIRQLEQEGYGIDAVRNRGYRLASCPDRLTKEELDACIRGNWAGKTVYHYEETGSTNDRAKELAAAGCPHGTLVTAEEQTAGRGRRGRSWSSPSGTAVYMSLVLRPKLPPTSASMVTLVAELAVSAAVKKVTGAESRIKWPNDLVVGNKKICGILTEMSAELDCIHYVVIGIGINTGQREFPEEISSTATSLFLETGKPVNRCRLVAAVMEELEGYYESYCRAGDLSLLKEEYNRELAGAGGEVRVLSPAGEYTGVSRGIDEEGRLLVDRADGTRECVVSGEVSVRGLYGYV